VTIDNLDPMEFLEATWQVVPAVYETLTRHGGSVAAVPWLASSIEVDQASRRVHIRLRERVRFHDGRPLTTRDVRAAFERLLRREASWSRWLLAPIRGAEALLEGRGDQLAGVHLHSDRDMVVELEQSVVTFPAILSAVPIVPEGSDPNAGSWQTGCLGTGPFRLRRFEPGRALELEANPYYWRDGFPRSEGVAFELGLSGDELAAALSSGRLHVGWGVSAGDMEALLNDRSLGVTWCEVPSLSTYFLACNCGSGPLAEESVRRKLASVVRSSGVVERVGRFGVPASGLIPPGLLGASAAWPTVTSAVPQSAEPIPLTVMILSVFEDSWPVFTDDLFAALEAAGFRINVVEETHDRAGALARWPVDLLLSRWVADYPDADSFVHGLLHSSQGDVGALCGSAEVDELIERGRETSDPARRHDLYRRIEREIAGQTRLIPLFHEQTYRLASAAVADPREALGQAAVAYEKLRLIGKGSSQG
jgi:peptide/nickel transport system substrate-binding protein/oligopeptide transport system substrate-binding protein